ncbi:MAG: TIGR00366 family protein [Candidatus Binatia bacterium]
MAPRDENQPTPSSPLDLLREIGAGLSRFTERWVPDSWVICVILTTIALLLAVFGAGVGAEEAVLAWGSGMWNLLALAMQFTIAMVAAHACVSSRPVFHLLDRLAGLPDPGRPLQAVALGAGFSLATAYLNWALNLVACALFVPFLCRRNPKTDVRVLVAACYLGIGTVWHCGLSGSAPLILATPGNPLVAPATGAPILERVIPVNETLFAPFNLAYMIVVGAVALLVVLAIHPRRGAVTLAPEQVEAILPKPPPEPVPRPTPGGRIESFFGWSWLAAALIAYTLGHSVATRGFGAAWTIDSYNMVFLVAALLLHRRPLPFLQACRQGVDATWGIVVQFPLYAGIFGLMTNTGLGVWIGGLFTRFATTATYPLVVYVYSAFMNFFVPSGGSKWLIEAPYLIPAARELDVSVTTVLLAYSYGDSTTNLVQPFFAIPILAVTRLRFGDVVGYTFLVAVACGAVSAVAMLLIPPRL